jgi:hypothetical protein
VEDGLQISQFVANKPMHVYATLDENQLPAAFVNTSKKKANSITNDMKVTIIQNQTTEIITV